MALNFPDAPSNGQIYNPAGSSGIWVWDGAKWIGGAQSDAFLPIVGGTLTGPLTINTPLTDPGPAAIHLSFNDTPFAGIASAPLPYVYTFIADLTGNPAIWLGGADDLTNYYSQVSHLFTDRSSMVPFFRITATEVASYRPLHINMPAPAPGSSAIHLLLDDLPFAGIATDPFPQTYTFIADVTGNPAIWLGGGADPSNYYTQTRHVFQSSNSLVEFLVIDATGISFNTTNSKLCGSSSNAWHEVWSYAYQNASDPSLKTDIAPAPAGALDQVIALDPVTYRWKEDAPTAPLHHGFLAPEVHRVMGGGFAGWSQDQESGLQGLVYNELTAVLWRAVQELAAKVTALEAPVISPS